MIYLALVRRAHCEKCHGEFDLKMDEEIPPRCLHCNTMLWLDGQSRRGRDIRARQGLCRKKKQLNKGTGFRKQQERGRLQYKHFKDKDGNPIRVGPLNPRSKTAEMLKKEREKKIGLTPP